MPPTRLVADAMLGSLARKLRAFGFDTVYYKGGDDAGLLRTAKSQRRFIVTADRGLASVAERSGLGVLLVVGSTDGRRISSMLAGTRKKGLRLSPGDPLCSLCNGSLVQVSRADVLTGLPKSVAERHRSFHECTNCGKLYWKGSHWKKLRRLERLFAASRPH
ncbi:MAG: Mut7-C RNAse domain-containing protein [Nitrososphaerales archaeon]|nr:Mut7-C RNAse domain-containing protein [Nitrososphaerales archaeon]